MGDGGPLHERLSALVRASPVLMRALQAAREVDAPDWLIGAGVIRNLVWDDEPGPLKDLDLVFFDADDLSPEREARVRAALAAREPDIPWDVKNQAAVHLWYPEVFGVEVEPLRSSADGVATWPETATAVAVRLRADDTLDVVAPCGLEDLFGLVCRRNPRRVTVEEYRRRIRTKGVAQRWPRVRIED